MTSTHPPLGHGIGLRTQHFARLLSEPPPVAWVEAITENFMAPGGRPIAVLEKLRREVPVVLHGVSLAVGSVDPIPERYLTALAAAVRRFEAAGRRGEQPRRGVRLVLPGRGAGPRCLHRHLELGPRGVGGRGTGCRARVIATGPASHSPGARAA